MLPALVPDWAQIGISAVGGSFATMLLAVRFFMPRSEVELKLRERQKSTHDLKNVVQGLVGKLHRLEKEVILSRADERWMMGVMQSIAKKVGANGFPTPPPVNIAEPEDPPSEEESG